MISITEKTQDKHRVLLAAQIAACFPDRHRNKAIGAVLANGDRLISCGHRITEHGIGEYDDKCTHAEHMAILSAGDSANGATLYVTLEPCLFRAHHEKWFPMPPCVELIVQSGISRVVIGSIDKDLGAGGAAYLIKKGIEVVRCVGLDERLESFTANHRIPDGFSEHYETLAKERGL